MVKKILILTLVLVVAILLGYLCFFKKEVISIKYNDKKYYNNLKIKLEKMYIDYVNDNIDNFQRKKYKITLYRLNSLGVDISEIKEKKCDFNETYALIDFSSSPYKIEVFLDCENYN